MACRASLPTARTMQFLLAGNALTSRLKSMDVESTAKHGAIELNADG